MTIPSSAVEEDLFTLAPVEGDEALFTLFTPELLLLRAIFVIHKAFAGSFRHCGPEWSVNSAHKALLCSEGPTESTIDPLKEIR